MPDLFGRLLWGLAGGLVLVSCAGAPANRPAAELPEAGAMAEGPAGGAAASPLIPADIRVSARGVFGGADVSYTAALERVSVAPQGDLPPVDLVAVSYVADTGASPQARPVLFIFNGGPISASLWLHVGALGPQRVLAPEDLGAPQEQFSLVANAHSPIDVADLVFFDPAATGFSRVAAGSEMAPYFSVRTDAAQFVAFAEAWLDKHDRAGAPVFLLGQSYGTHRAAEAAGQIAEAGRLNLAGVFLMGQAVNVIEYSQRRQNILSYVASLPTLAAIAWDLGEVNRAGRSFEAFMAEVATFAEAQYLPALFKGQRITPDELARIAAKLEAYTGIDAEIYEAGRLRLSKEAFRVELLKAQGLILGRNDGRYTGPLAEGGDPSGVLQEAYWRLFSAYLEGTFGALPMQDYQRGFSAGNFDSWDWGAASPFGQYAYGERIDAAFQVFPHLRVFIGTGYHDTLTTAGAADYLVDQSDWPKAQVRQGRYIGGHMPYSVAATAKAFGEDVRSWVRGWSAPGAAE